MLDYFKSLLNFIIVNFCFRDPNDIDVEILFKSENYIIVNKPEDVFINNHNKEVSASI